MTFQGRCPLKLKTLKFRTKPNKIFKKSHLPCCVIHTHIYEYNCEKFKGKTDQKDSFDLWALNREKKKA